MARNIQRPIEYVITETGCFEVTSHKPTKMGTGYISLGRKGIRAHRLAYAERYGPIPDGMDVLHRCDNTICINPDHLFLGDQHDNNVDRDKKHRMAHGIRIATAKLNPDKVAYIRDHFIRGRDGNVASLSSEFGVSKTTIYDIVNRNHWVISD